MRVAALPIELFSLSKLRLKELDPATQTARGIAALATCNYCILFAAFVCKPSAFTFCTLWPPSTCKKMASEEQAQPSRMTDSLDDLVAAALLARLPDLEPELDLGPGLPFEFGVQQQREFALMLYQQQQQMGGQKPPEKKTKFVCQEEGCGKTFSLQSSLTRHMRMHTGERFTYVLSV